MVIKVSVLGGQRRGTLGTDRPVAVGWQVLWVLFPRPAGRTYFPKWNSNFSTVWQNSYTFTPSLLTLSLQDRKQLALSCFTHLTRLGP